MILVWPVSRRRASREDDVGIWHVTRGQWWQSEEEERHGGMCCPRFLEDFCTHDPDTCALLTSTWAVKKPQGSQGWHVTLKSVRTTQQDLAFPNTEIAFLSFVHWNPYIFLYFAFPVLPSYFMTFFKAFSLQGMCHNVSYVVAHVSM